jgi:hypothetical protein
MWYATIDDPDDRRTRAASCSLTMEPRFEPKEHVTALHSPVPDSLFMVGFTELDSVHSTSPIPHFPQNPDVI